MRVRNRFHPSPLPGAHPLRLRIVAVITAFGLAALTLSGCSTGGTAMSAQLVAAQPSQTSAAASTIGGSTGDKATPNTPDPQDTPDVSTEDSPTTNPANDTSVTTSLDPDAPNPNLIVGSTAHRTDGKHIALTFDDGPDPVWTPQVLALLAQYHAVATFCEIGNNATRYPALVRRIVAAGDTLCDHTMTHDEHLPSRSHQRKYDEINGAMQAITAAAPGARVRFYRAPGGAFSKAGDPDSVQRIAAGLGMQPLAWSIDTVDWQKPGVAAIVKSIESAGTHDVILLHDAGGDRSQTIAALRIALPWLVANDYQFDLPA